MVEKMVKLETGILYRQTSFMHYSKTVFKREKLDFKLLMNCNFKCLLAGCQKPWCHSTGCQQGSDTECLGWCRIWCRWTKVHGAFDRYLGWRGTKVDSRGGSKSEKTEGQCRSVVFSF